MPLIYYVQVRLSPYLSVSQMCICFQFSFQTKLQTLRFSFSLREICMYKWILISISIFFVPWEKLFNWWFHWINMYMYRLELLRKYYHYYLSYFASFCFLFRFLSNRITHWFTPKSFPFFFSYVYTMCLLCWAYFLIKQYFSLEFLYLFCLRLCLDRFLSEC